MIHIIADIKMSREAEEAVRPTWRRAVAHVFSFKRALWKPTSDITPALSILYIVIGVTIGSNQC